MYLYVKDKGVDTASETGSDTTLQHITSKEDDDIVSSLIWISLPSSANMNLNLHSGLDFILRRPVGVADLAF